MEPTAPPAEFYGDGDGIEMRAIAFESVATYPPPPTAYSRPPPPSFEQAKGGAYQPASTHDTTLTDPPNYQQPPPTGPPPSYHSLFGKVKKIQKDNTWHKWFSYPMSTVGFTLFLTLFMGVPISMIVMGALYLEDCRAERMIPIYLIVAGSFGLPRNFFMVARRCCKSQEELLDEAARDDDDDDESISNLACFVIDCFQFAWFIAGCVYVYRTKDDFQSVDKTNYDYCDYTLYWYSFWILTAFYIMSGSFCLYFFGVACISGCCDDSDD